MGCKDLTAFRGRRGAGFTLVEVLAAMTILAMLVVFIGQIFVQSTAAWQRGTRQVDTDGQVRAVFSLIREKLSTAVADERLPFYLAQDGTRLYDGNNSARLGIVTFAGRHHSSQIGIEEIGLYVTNKGIARFDGGLVTNQFSLYFRHKNVFAPNGPAPEIIQAYTNWGGTAANWFNRSPDTTWALGATARTNDIVALIDNVVRFDVRAGYTNAAGRVVVNQYSVTNDFSRLPMFADIYLEVLAEKDAQLAATLRAGGAGAAAALSDHLNRSVRRYSTRIYFNNRQGYGREN